MLLTFKNYMKKKIIVSSSDEKYYDLLKELLISLQKSKILDDYDFAVLDTGLNEEQKKYLKDHNVIIKDAEWNTRVSKYKIRSREHLKTQFARAFLPDYFPNYKIYIWLDADIWLNDLESFLLYEIGAKKNKICITPQTDRAYGPLAKVDWFFRFPKKIRTINYKNISRSVSNVLGRKYAMFPTLNAGAFAINDNLDLWKCFQKNIILASKKGRIFGTDQVALALSIYEDGLPAEFLPAYCNWMCEYHLPIYDRNTNKFLEPYLPNHPIGLMHLAGLDQIRINNAILSDIKDTEGLIIKKSIRYVA